MTNFAQFLALFRSLIPSWRFFDRAGHMFELEYRIHSAGQVTPWFKVTRKIPRRQWIHLIFNPQGNFDLVQQSQLQRLAEEATSSQGPPPREHWTSYQLVRHWVHLATSKPQGNVEWRLVTTTGDEVIQSVRESNDDE